MSGASGISRLAFRHALLAAVLGVAIGAAFSVLQVGSDYQESVEAERREILQMLEVMREPAAQASYNLNTEAAQVVVHGALSYVPVQSARLVSDFGETLAHGTHDPKLAPGADAWWTRFVPPTQTYSLSLEFGTAFKRVGELTVVTAQAPRVERFIRGALHDMGVNVWRAVTVALALGVLSYLTLTRPLTAIARRIALASAGRAGAEPLAEASRQDEIGEIAAAFERYEREAGERASSLQASARALAASELRYRRIVETAGEGVWQVDSQGITTLANLAMARMLGTTPDLLVGRSMKDFIDPDEHGQTPLALHQRPGADGEPRTIRLLCADGHSVWAEVSTCAIADAEGVPTGTLAMVTDATERRRRDAELRASNARLTSMVADLERHKSDMAQIAELNELLQSARTEDEAFRVIRNAAARLFAEAGGGFAVVGEGDEMAVVGAWGVTGGLASSYHRSDCWAVRRGGPHRHSPLQGSCCGHQADPRSGTTQCTPLYVEGELLGVLHLHAESEDLTCCESMQQLIEVFGEVVKLGLSNLRLRDSLREQALRDELTGLPNRRLFDATLPRELARCLRTSQPLTVAVIDVDHFKRFNDQYGHDAGDLVLRAVAQALGRAIRASDMACRYGGDEFMCLLPGLAATDAATRFERALRKLAQDAGQAPLQGETVTFTVGLASAPECGTDPAGLTRAADAALYVAKEKGRNRVEVSGLAALGPELVSPQI